MASKKVVGYEEKNYLQKKEIYDSISQAFSDIKYEEYGKHSWSKKVDDLKGVTMRLIGEDMLELTYHRYEVTTIEGLARMENDGKDFIKEVVKALKKQFRKLTKKHLKLEEVKNGQAIDKVSRLQADSSWMLGSSRYGYGKSAVGRYLLRDSFVYSFDIDLLG